MVTVASAIIASTAAIEATTATAIVAAPAVAASAATSQCWRRRRAYQDGRGAGGRRDQVKHLVELTDGKLQVPHWTAEFKQPYVFDGSSWERSPSMKHWEDLAWRTQDDTEKVLLARAHWLRET